MTQTIEIKHQSIRFESTLSLGSYFFKSILLVITVTALSVWSCQAHCHSGKPAPPIATNQFETFSGTTNFLTLISNYGSETRIDEDGDGISDTRIIESGPFVVTQKNPYGNVYSSITISKNIGTGVRVAKFQLDVKLKRYVLRALTFERFEKRFAEASALPPSDESDEVPGKTESPEDVSPKPNKTSPMTSSGNQELCGLRQVLDADQAQWRALAKKIKLSAFVDDEYSQKLLSSECKSPELNRKLKTAFAENMFSNSQTPSRFASCVMKVSGLHDNGESLISKSWSDYLSVGKSRPIFSCSASLPAGKAASFDPSKDSGQISISTTVLNSANQALVSKAVFHELLHRSGIVDEEKTEQVADCCSEGFNLNDPACRQLSSGIYGVVKLLKQRSQSIPKSISQLKSEFGKLEKPLDVKNCDAKAISKDCADRVDQLLTSAISKVESVCRENGGPADLCKAKSSSFARSFEVPRLLRCLKIENPVEGTCLLQGGIPTNGKYSISLPSLASIDSVPADRTRTVQAPVTNDRYKANRSAVRRENNDSESTQNNRAESSESVAGATSTSSGQSRTVAALPRDQAVTLAEMTSKSIDPTSRESMAQQASESGSIVKSVRQQAEHVFGGASLVPSAGATTLSGSHDTSAGSSRAAAGTEMVQASIPFSSTGSASSSASAGSSTGSGGGSATGTSTSSSLSRSQQNQTDPVDATGDRSDVTKTADGGRSTRAINRSPAGSQEPSGPSGSVPINRAPAGGPTLTGEGGSGRADVQAVGAGGSGGQARAARGARGGPAGASAAGGGSPTQVAQANQGSNPGRGPAGFSSPDDENFKTPFNNPSEIKTLINKSKLPIETLLEKKWFNNRLREIDAKIVESRNHWGPNNASKTWNINLFRNSKQR